MLLVGGGTTINFVGEHKDSCGLLGIVHGAGTRPIFLGQVSAGRFPCSANRYHVALVKAHRLKIVITFGSYHQETIDHCLSQSRNHLNC